MLTSYVEESHSWEAKSRSGSQEIFRLLWKLKVHYRVQKNQPLVPVLSQVHPVHTFSPNFPEVYFNIIFPSMPRSSKSSSTLQIFEPNLVCTSHLSRACYMPFPSNIHFPFPRSLQRIRPIPRPYPIFRNKMCFKMSC